MKQNASLDDFVSADAAMQACLEQARVAASTDLPILVLGESGTGKTVLAGAIHHSSPRAPRPFVSFNAAALSDTLLDSQLFGHERGAFTGAQVQVRGKFELAHGGTLFVDEIADMSRSAQAKILRAIDCGEFERLGSDSLRRADVRVISATHLPLDRYLETDRFRMDLFYRISGFTIQLPPLRKRPNDLRAIIGSEVAAAADSLGKAITGLSRAAAELLLDHAWPGNLRELKRVIHTAVALTDDDIVRREALHLDPVGTLAHTGNGTTAQRSSDLDRETVRAHDLSLRSAELRHIRYVFDHLGGNKRQAARALGVSRSTLDRKLAQLDA
jgi:transcriptional regulator with PAS, ATPase and Fis domain